MVDVASSLSSALGVGSGINTSQLVADLTAASFDPKISAVNSRISTANSRISALASAKSSLDTFSGALTELLKSKDYSGQPLSNDASIATVSLLSGGVPQGLPAQLEVTQLANAQVLESTTLTAATSTAGTGTLTLTVGGNDYDVVLTAPSNTLNDLASAINNSGAGVTATVVTDKNGARLVLKGATGADKAFTIAAGVDADTDLQRFVWNGTSGSLTRRQTAQNALIKVDNVSMAFDSNEISTAIPYLRIDLNKAAPGTTVTLATNQPTSSMSELVQDFVAAYNTLKRSLNSATAAPTNATASGSANNGSGLLSGDSGVRDMANRLATLTNATLSSTGEYKTLVSLGVSTNRDGTLSIDTDKLEAAIADDPEGVTQMLNPTAPDDDHPGLAGALKSITDYINGDNGPLAASKAIYDKLKTTLSKQLDALNTQESSYSEQLTKTYTAMQSRLLQFKATQSYLEQQVAAWNNQNN